MGNECVVELLSVCVDIGKLAKGEKSVKIKVPDFTLKMGEHLELRDHVQSAAKILFEAFQREEDLAYEQRIVNKKSTE